MLLLLCRHCRLCRRSRRVMSFLNCYASVFAALRVLLLYHAQLVLVVGTALPRHLRYEAVQLLLLLFLSLSQHQSPFLEHDALGVRLRVELCQGHELLVLVLLLYLRLVRMLRKDNLLELLLLLLFFFLGERRCWRRRRGGRGDLPAVELILQSPPRVHEEVSHCGWL